MMFGDFLKEGLVKRIMPDVQLAKSLVKIAEARMKNIELLPMSDGNSFMVIENCYEAIKELSDALLALKGFKSYSHEANIEFLKEFYSVKLSAGDINRANRYRILRNDIKYRGLVTTKKEAENVLGNVKVITKTLMEILDNEQKKRGSPQKS